MPVKVRCQSCEKVFAAPDAARGKLVKCPGCEEKVKVPAGDAAKSKAAAKPAAKKSVKKDEHHDDHEHALKSLDLDNIEDENTRVCPKCGQEIYEEEVTECPACGLNFETGLTKEKQKGVDPKIFFRVVVKDSIKFLKEHKPFAIRTGVYTLIYSLLFFACLFMVTWCVNLPPRMFWAGLTLITFMVPFGWQWFLNGEIIKFTMDKKEKFPRINFDMFTCVALGIKFFLWQAVMGAQTVLLLVAAFLGYKGMMIPALALFVVGELILALMIPQVMIHMTMPITTRGWLAHIQFQTWSKSFGACAYWCVLTFVALLPALLPVGITTAIGWKGTGQFFGSMFNNYQTNARLGSDLSDYAAAKMNPKKGAPLPTDVKEDDPKYKNKPLPWKGVIVPVIGLVLSQMLLGFGAVFAMRANGLFGLYYKKTLKLEAMAKEIKWVSKDVKADDDPAMQKAKQKQQLIQNIVAVVGFLAVIGGVAWYMMRKPAEVAAPAPGPPDAAQPGQAAPAAGVAPAATPAGAAALAPPM